MENNAHGGNNGKGLWKKIFALAVAALLSLNLYHTAQLRSELQTLRSETQNISARLSDQTLSISGALDAALNRMQETIEAGASLLSETESSFAVRDGKLRVSLAFTPKAIAPDETARVVFRSDGQELSVEAAATSGRYTAAAVLAPCDVVSLSVLLLAPDGALRQETLPALNIAEMLAFECQSEWIDHYFEGDGEVMLATLWGQGGSTIDSPPYASPDRVQFVVEDDAGNELGRVDAKDARRDGLLERMGYEQGWIADENAAAYYSDLTLYLAQAGQYNIYFELEAEGLTYRVLCADFQRQEDASGNAQSSSSSSGGFGTAYPEWGAVS